MLLFRRNLPGWERLLRAMMGLAVIACALFAGWTGWWLASTIAIGAGLIGTALAGSCPACTVAGRRLAP